MHPLWQQIPEPRCCWLGKSVNFPHWRYKRLSKNWNMTFCQRQDSPSFFVKARLFISLWMIDVCHCCGVAWLDPMACQQVSKQQNWILKLLIRKLDSTKDQAPCTHRELPRTPDPLLTTRRGNASFPTLGHFWVFKQANTEASTLVNTWGAENRSNGRSMNS